MRSPWNKLQVPTEMLLQAILLLILVSFSASQKSDPVDQPRDVPGCDVIKCIDGGCGQFEQCLLVADMEGCNPQLITYSASDAYERCLFGREGFCSLTPLVGCYETSLQGLTRTPLPPALSTSPETLAAFMRVLLEDAADTTNFLTTCSIPVSAVQQMLGCVVSTSGEILENCEKVMPIATKRYFSSPNRGLLLTTGINNLVTFLSNYSAVCSNFGEWTSWINEVHPTTANGSDFETQVNPCGVGRGTPTAVDCDIDTTYPQLCGVAQGCTRQQVYSCIGRLRQTTSIPAGLVCRAEDQGESLTGDLCPCCDYRVRYLCPAASDVITISPSFGPASGNTSVTLVGSQLNSQFPIVSIGSLPCAIQFRSQFKIVCTTPPIDLRTTNEQTEDVFLRVGSSTSSFSIDTNATFTYRRNVEVDKVYNLDTLVSGGTEVTVEGTNFLSITQPRMTVTVLYKDNGVLRTWVYESTCRVVSDTIIQCPVPALINPWKFTNNTRPPPPTSSSPPDNVIQFLTSHLEDDDEVEYAGWHHNFLRLTGRAPRRERRATCGNKGAGIPINDNDQLTYRVDIDLDGQAVSGDHTLEVYVDPEIEPFPERPACRVFRSWLLAQDTEMEISGSRLNDGLDCNQYNVRVGDAVCSVQDLFSNKIICHPPDTRPYPGAGDTEGKLGVEVLIGTGHLRFSVGCLDYEEELLDNPYGLYGLIAGLSALALVILLITICCCCHYRRKLAKY